MIEHAASQSVPWLATGSNSTWMMPSRTLFCWGGRRRGGGCLGHGEDLSNQLLPKKVEGWAPGQ